MSVDLLRVKKAQVYHTTINHHKTEFQRDHVIRKAAINFRRLVLKTKTAANFKLRNYQKNFTLIQATRPMMSTFKKSLSFNQQSF